VQFQYHLCFQACILSHLYAVSKDIKSLYFECTTATGFLHLGTKWVRMTERIIPRILSAEKWTEFLLMAPESIALTVRITSQVKRLGNKT